MKNIRKRSRITRKFRIGRLILYIMVMLLLCNFAFAALTDNMATIFNFESDPSSADLEDQVGGNDSSGDSVRGRVTGINNLGWDFESTESDYVVIPTFLEAQSIDEYSVSCWVKWETKTTSQAFFGMYNTGGFGYYVGIDNDNDEFTWSIGTDGGYNIIENDTGTIKNGIWYQVGFTYDEDVMMRAYINGSRAGSVVPSNVEEVEGVVTFGQRNNPPAAGAWAFDGVIDECYFWNRVLTDGEMATLGSNTSAGFYPFTVADSTFPSYTNFINNGSSVFQNGNVNFSVTLTDNIGLSSYVFAHNQTGTMVNGTLSSISGTSVNISEILTVTLPRKNFICGQISFNDTSGNANQTNLSCFSVQTAPTFFDLLFRNQTSSEYKTLFGEGEDFYIFINHTYNNGTPLTPENTNCNVTVVNGLTEVDGSNDNFTICGSGCDFNIYNDSFTHQSTTNAVRDIGHALVCNEQLQQEDAIVNISCGGISYQEARDGSTIPLCSDGFAFVTVNTSVCISSLEVNISIEYSGAIQRRKRVLDIAMDREYNPMIMLNGTEITYNTTLNLWMINHTHEFYEHGIKNISGNCTNIETELSNSAWESITIVNQPPSIFINQVNNSAGFFNLTDLIQINNFTGIWTWLTSVVDDDLTIVNYTFYNSSGSIKQSNQSSFPLLIKTPSGFFNPLESPYNFTIWANDTNRNTTQVSIRLNITEQDITPPVITMISPAANNDTFIIDVWINFTTNERTNCSLNNSLWGRFSDNSTYYAFNETQSPDGIYNILISCNDSAFFTNTGTFIVNFSRDTTTPIITSLIPAEDNSSEIVNEEIIFLNFTLTDNIRLFVYNLTIRYKPTNEIKFNVSGYISGTSFSSKPSVNVSGWVNDTWYTETLRVCDGHTSLEIPDATGIIKGNDKLTYQFGSTWIKIKSMNGHEQKTDTEKKTDRYNFKFYYSQPTTSKLFKVTSNKKIFYLHDSEYKAHFVIGENWVDFDLKDNEVVVEKGDCDNETGTLCDYFVYIDNDKDYIEMNSVGFLNCVTEVYEFNLISRPTGILYRVGLMAGNFFNNNALDTSTTAGVLLFFFLLLCLIALVIFSEYVAVPAVMLFTAIYGFFFGILIYVSISAILGIVFIILGFAYMMRSITFA